MVVISIAALFVAALLVQTRGARRPLASLVGDVRGAVGKQIDDRAVRMAAKDLANALGLGNSGSSLSDVAQALAAYDEEQSGDPPPAGGGDAIGDVDSAAFSTKKVQVRLADGRVAQYTLRAREVTMLAKNRAAGRAVDEIAYCTIAARSAVKRAADAQHLAKLGVRIIGGAQ